MSCNENQPLTDTQLCEWATIERLAAALVARALAHDLTVQINHVSVMPPAQGRIKHEIKIGVRKATHEINHELPAVQRGVADYSNAEAQE